MNTIVSALFADPADADNAVNRLIGSGMPLEDISLVQRHPSSRSASQSLLMGTAMGSLAGWATGLASANVPGLGPMTAWGPAATRLLGTLSGGLVGGLVDFGIHPNQGPTYQKALTHGHVMIAVNTDEPPRVAAILKDAGAVQVDRHARPNRGDQS